MRRKRSKKNQRAIRALKRLTAKPKGPAPFKQTKAQKKASDEMFKDVVGALRKAGYTVKAP